MLQIFLTFVFQNLKLNHNMTNIPNNWNGENKEIYEN